MREAYYVGHEADTLACAGFLGATSPLQHRLTGQGLFTSRRREESGKAPADSSAQRAMERGREGRRRLTSGRNPRAGPGPADRPSGRTKTRRAAGPRVGPPSTAVTVALMPGKPGRRGGGRGGRRPAPALRRRLAPRAGPGPLPQERGAGRGIRAPRLLPSFFLPPPLHRPPRPSGR